MNPLLLPIIAAQGLWIRRHSQASPPAGGPVIGLAGFAGTGADVSPIRVAIVGESTAAGCGVMSHDQGFPGCFARELAHRSGRQVQWEVVGQDGATARRIRYRLVPQLGRDLSVAVLLAGVNDVLSRRKPDQWGEDVTAILDELSARAELVVMTGIPSFEVLPSLPAALARYLGARAEALDVAARQVCDRHQGAAWIPSAAAMVDMEPDFFAADRFHPSAIGYERWARSVVDQLPPLSA